jgi:hypothetical protein
MFGGCGSTLEVSGVKFPCGVCGKGAGSNSIMCTPCGKWVHKRCSGVRGRLTAVKDFVCRTCKEGRDGKVNGGVQVGTDTFERVVKFCYLGDMLASEGGAEHAIVYRIGKAWRKFRELKPVLCDKHMALNVKRKVYEACVRSCLTYGSETWTLNVENERKLERTETRMIRIMCGITLRDRVTNVELKRMFGIESVLDVIRRSRLRWFGHVERKFDDDWVKHCTVLEVEGKRPRGRPKKTWMDMINADLKRWSLKREDAQDRSVWRRLTSGGRGEPGRSLDQLDGHYGLLSHGTCAFKRH